MNKIIEFLEKTENLENSDVLSEENISAILEDMSLESSIVLNEMKKIIEEREND